MRIKLQHATRANNVINDDPDAEFFYFEIQADGNYETILTSEVYSSKRAAMHAIGLITSDAIGARIAFVDETA